MAEELTPIDIRILEQLQKDSSLSTSELAEKVGTSQSPCWRRLQRLREEGYIRKQVALVDRSRLEPSFYILAFLRMSTLSEEERAEFLRKIEMIPEITECYAVFGEADLVMKILAPTMEWYQNFIFKTLQKLPGVRDIQSTVTLTELKYTTAIPIRGNRAL